MSKPSAAQSRDAAVPPYQNDTGGEEVAMPTIADQARTKRLRMGLILANVGAWLVIIIVAKWLVF